MANAGPRAIAFSTRSSSARINAAFEWKRNAGVTDGNSASPRPGQYRQSYGRDHLREHGDNILCCGGLLWIGWRETDPARHPGGAVGRSCWGGRFGGWFAWRNLTILAVHLCNDA